MLWGLDFLKAVNAALAAGFGVERAGLNARDSGDGCRGTLRVGLATGKLPNPESRTPNPLPRVGEHVVVIGGGNVAVDVALTARRLGAKTVELACLESRDIMPASKHEIEEALEEGIKLSCSWGPQCIVTKDDHVRSILLKTCTRVFDESGRFDPQYDESKTCSLDCDTVILAIGQAFDLGFLGTPPLLEVERGTIKVNPDKLHTSNPKVFACGDLVKFPGSVVDAVATGRKAASSIDRFLGGAGVVDETWIKAETPNHNIGKVDGFAKLTRKKPGAMDVSDPRRKTGFDEVYSCLAEDAAVAEASRCLRCDLRLLIPAAPLPPLKIRAFNAETIAKTPESEGVYQLYDSERQVLKIAGVQNLKANLQEELEKAKNAKFFEFVEDKMYSKRESEMLQHYLQVHGKMPGAGSGELDDLF